MENDEVREKNVGVRGQETRRLSTDFFLAFVELPTCLLITSSITRQTRKSRMPEVSLPTS